jgi:hypothetical protein
MDVIVSWSIMSAAIAAWLAVLEFGVKVVAEWRLQRSAASEIDTRMSKLFTELMWVAHGRGGSQVSEKAVEALFEKGLITEADCRNVEELKKKLQACVIVLPVGEASQDAAIASIAVLGRRYRILREPAIAALNSLKSFKKEEAEKALRTLGGKCDSLHE